MYVSNYLSGRSGERIGVCVPTLPKPEEQKSALSGRYQINRK